VVVANFTFTEHDNLTQAVEDFERKFGAYELGDLIASDENDFPLFRPPGIGARGFRRIEDYTDYDIDLGDSARAKKMPNDDKNWADLTAMLNHYNDEWQLDTEYLTDYGCHCRNNLDRRQQGLGNPYGAVDTECHMWKQCLKCAVSLYGDECTAQDIKYNSNFVDGGYQCQNAPGTCRKAICECDLAFAQHMGREAKEWDIKYWAMDMGGFQHFNTTQCVQPIGGNYKARCCGNILTDYLTMYNANKQCCDVDGLLHPAGTCTTQPVYYQQFSDLA